MALRLPLPAASAGIGPMIVAGGAASRLKLAATTKNPAPKIAIARRAYPSRRALGLGLDSSVPFSSRMSMSFL